MSPRLELASTSTTTTTRRRKDDNHEDDDRENMTDKQKTAKTVTTSSGSTTAFQYLDDSKSGIVWFNVYIFLVMHSLFIYALYLFFWQRHFTTGVFGYCCGLWGGLGVTAGAHRLWSHRSYKARLPLRVFLALGFTLAGQNDLYTWCRDHRSHHRYSETDGDPHNSKRGAFFAHLGWLLTRKHPDVVSMGRHVDLSDLWLDPVVRLQKRLFYPLFLLLAIALPIWIPVHYWGESLIHSVVLSLGHRYVVNLHSTWFVNSAAHMWGDRPYNLAIQPRENLWVSFGALGEGFHNYHHTFPWDYATSELGWTLNTTKFFIDCMAAIGLAHGRKHLSRVLVDRRKELVVRGGGQHLRLAA